eukprot:COSAG01_NODE_3134_length_6530_cov_80.581092_1_plen_93_part_00
MHVQRFLCRFRDTGIDGYFVSIRDAIKKAYKRHFKERVSPHSEFLQAVEGLGCKPSPISPYVPASWNMARSTCRDFISDATSSSAKTYQFGD